MQFISTLLPIYPNLSQNSLLYPTVSINMVRATIFPSGPPYLYEFICKNQAASDFGKSLVDNEKPVKNQISVPTIRKIPFLNSPRSLNKGEIEQYCTARLCGRDQVVSMIRKLHCLRKSVANPYEHGGNAYREAHSGQ